MKLKVLIVDLELSPVAKNRLLRGGILAAVLLGGATLAYADWTVPVTFQANTALHAADLNNNFAALADAGAQLQAQVAALGVPSGTVVAFPGPVANIPAGWVLCDGTTYNGALAQYAALYAAIGTSNGGNVGAQEFNVPDYRGYFLRGLDPSATVDPDGASRTPAKAGGNSGPEVGSLEADAMLTHTHAVTAAVSNTSFGEVPNQGGGGNALTGQASLTTTAAGSSVETRPVNVAVNYIIKL